MRRYSAKILGDSPTWARSKRDCLKRYFVRKGVKARVTVVGSDVKVAISGSGSAMTAAERACRI